MSGHGDGVAFERFTEFPAEVRLMVWAEAARLLRFEELVKLWGPLPSAWMREVLEGWLSGRERGEVVCRFQGGGTALKFVKQFVHGM
jgi:hypothetical protein